MSIDLARQDHDFAIGRRPQGRYIAAIGLLHLALFWAATRPVHMGSGHDDRVWLQLMPPLPPLPPARGVPIEPAPPPARLPPQPSLPARPAGAAVAPAPKDAAIPTPPALMPERPHDDALSAEAAPAASKAGTLPLAQQALQAAGAIDRQLRAEHPQEFTAPPETAQTRLAKGFAEAHAAVKPKWFEAARIELFSAPNDPKRIYRVITAAGEYCIYLPDKGNMSLNLSARSGYAGFGEGTAAPCPIRF
ncbi:hypothetical protein GCN74_22860 [Janthinobacterium sp. FT14W]|uniref:hypothetical protein n=1 Tax=Janthinobacterium sp. FT14W TaxID=2654253 RepID=UPI001265A40D|nr:hypothetical protein [Janthinobacterium sp. FT14W]KAB8056751.1 hypothetical protein GCN74_22860 [Janthinobacterium sp. FT14W]